MIIWSFDDDHRWSVLSSYEHSFLQNNYSTLDRISFMSDIINCKFSLVGYLKPIGSQKNSFLSCIYHRVVFFSLFLQYSYLCKNHLHLLRRVLLSFLFFFVFTMQIMYTFPMTLFQHLPYRQANDCLRVFLGTSEEKKTNVWTMNILRGTLLV